MATTSRIRAAVASPAASVLLLAPVFGEGLSGSTSPLQLALPWNLAFMSALYGCGALLCREVARRLGLGVIGLVLLAAAYGVFEEGLVDRYWFFETFWRESGVGTYGVVWHTNTVLAMHLTAFHVVVSICSSVLVVEWLHPGRRDSAWASRPWLVVAGVVLASTPIIYGEPSQRPPLPVLAAAAALVVALVALAVVLGRRRAHVVRRPAGRPRRWLGVAAFLAVLTHWVVTYGVAGTGLPEPVGIALVAASVVVPATLVGRMMTTDVYGTDGVRVVAGVVCFFLALDVLVGVTGQFDTGVAALLLALAVRPLRRRFLATAGARMAS